MNTRSIKYYDYLENPEKEKKPRNHVLTTLTEAAELPPECLYEAAKTTIWSPLFIRIGYVVSTLISWSVLLRMYVSSYYH